MAMSVHVGVDWRSFYLALSVSLLTISIIFAIRLRSFLKWRRNVRGVRRVNMVRVDIPFSISLEKESKVKAVINTKVKSKIEIYWGISVHDFHREIEKDWQDEDMLVNTAYSAKEISKVAKGEYRFILDFRKPLNNSPVGSQYPAAVIVRNQNPSQSGEAGALIATIHLVSCPMSARIIAQYMKLNSGQVTLLQRLYPSGLYEEGSIDLCVVCSDNPVTRVVLPCKHACLCKSCFEMVIICPMCRAGIQSYFTIPSEGDMDREAAWSSKFQSMIKSLRMKF